MRQTSASNTGKSPGFANRAERHISTVREGIYGKLCLMDVLVAATGFAALLVTIMKSETVRKMLLDIVKQALSMGG